MIFELFLGSLGLIGLILGMLLPLLPFICLYLVPDADISTGQFLLGELCCIAESVVSIWIFRMCIRGPWREYKEEMREIAWQERQDKEKTPA